MTNLKQMLFVFFILQVLGFSTVQAKSVAEQKRSYLRRLLENNILSEDKVQEIVQAENLEPLEDVSVDNSTVVIFDWESIDHLTGDSEGEGGRRSLVASCRGNQYADYSSAMRFNGVRADGKCLNGWKKAGGSPEKILFTRSKHVRIDVSVTNKGGYCPGCLEQLYFGLMNERYDEIEGDCVNLGNSYGTRSAGKTFSLKRSYYWVYAFSTWQYHCYQFPPRNGVRSYIESVDGAIRRDPNAGLIYGLVIAQS